MITAALVVAGMVGALMMPSQQAQALKCSVLPDDLCANVDDPLPATSKDPKDTDVWKLLSLGVQLMTGGVIILAIVGIIYGSILYISAGPNQEQVKKAKGVFTNVVIGILAFAFMFAILQWLIPGGVF